MTDVSVIININEKRVPVKAEKSLVELERAENKPKKTCDAIERDIAGIGEDYFVSRVR